MAIEQYTPRARQDLREIGSYIASFNPDAAERVLDAISQTVHRLSRLPRIGERCDQLFPGLRRFPVGRYPYVVYFRPLPNGVRVLRIVHAARDAGRLQLNDEE